VARGLLWRLYCSRWRSNPLDAITWGAKM